MWTAVTVALFMTLVAGAADAHGPRRGLPSEVRRMLDEQYPGWRFATIIHSLQHQLPANVGPEWTAGDYDGDRQRDRLLGGLEGPPNPPALGSAPAKPERSSMSALGSAPAKPERSSMPRRRGRTSGPRRRDRY